VPPLQRLCCLLASLATLSACTTQQTAPTSADSWIQHQQTVAALSSWEFSGKVSIKTATNADSARLHWLQQGDHLRLEVSGPVGLKKVIFERDGTSLKVFRNKQWQPLPSVAGGLEAELGWPLPLDLLSWWLRGLPAPGVTITSRHVAEGRLQELGQDGWTLHYLAYTTVGGINLPSSIRFQRDDVSGKILLKRWTLPRADINKPRADIELPRADTEKPKADIETP